MRRNTSSMASWIYIPLFRRTTGSSASYARYNSSLGDGELKNEDLAFANMLYEHNGVMGTIHLVEVGQYCTVDDPLWKKMEGKVIKIDRGRKRCCVEFTFDNTKRTVWLGYELIRLAKEELPEI